MALVTLTACGSASTPTRAPTPAVIPSSTPLPLPASTSTPNPSELRSTILAALNAQNNQTWRYRADTVLANGETHNTVLEYTPPDRFHVVSDSTNDLVIISQTVYVKQGSAWSESQISAASIVDRDSAKRLEESISQVQFIGADSLNGKPMLVCQYKSKTKIGDAESTVQTKLWIGMADKLPYKMILDGETASLNQSTGQIVGVKSTSTLVYEYDPTIKIDVPVK